jgi:hypothetical protein
MWTVDLRVFTWLKMHIVWASRESGKVIRSSIWFYGLRKRIGHDLMNISVTYHIQEWPVSLEHVFAALSCAGRDISWALCSP